MATGKMEISTSPVIGNTPSLTLALDGKGKSEDSTYPGLSQPQVLRVSIPSGNSSINLAPKDMEYCPGSGASTPRRLGSFVFPRVSSSASIRSFTSPPPSPRAYPSTPVHGPSMDLVKVRIAIEKRMEQIEHLGAIVNLANRFWKGDNHWCCESLMVEAFLDTDAPIPTLDEAIRTYPMLRIHLGTAEGPMDSHKRTFAIVKAMTETNRGFMTLPFIVKDNTDQPKADDRIIFDKLLARDDAISNMLNSQLGRLVGPYNLVNRSPEKKAEILASSPTLSLDEARKNLCFLWPTFRAVRLSVLEIAQAVLNTKGAETLPTPVSPGLEEDGGLFMKQSRRHSRQLSVTSLFSPHSRKSSVISMASGTFTQAASPGSTPGTSVTNSPAITPQASPVLQRRFPRLMTSEPSRTPKSPKMTSRTPSANSLSSMTVPMARSRGPVKPPSESPKKCSCKHHFVEDGGRVQQIPL